jgi:hypothetical protein
MLAGRSWSTDNGPCKEHQSKEDRAAYRQISCRLVKLPLESSKLTTPGLLTCHSIESTRPDKQGAVNVSVLDPLS